MKAILPILLALSLAALLLGLPLPAASMPAAVTAAALTPALPEPVAAFDPALRQQIAATDQPTSYIVLLAEQADLSPAYAIADWEARGQFVVERLRAAARRSQPPVQALLAARQTAGDVVRYQSLYIINGFLVTSGVETFDLLSRQPGVAALEADRPLPKPELNFSQAVRPARPLAVEWGVAQIGADAIWHDFGVRGEGVVVANIDSGVEYQHPALINSYRGNLGGGYFDHDFSWVDPERSAIAGPAPKDSHGTHTMGTMVGDGGPGNQVGVAPGAQWIAATGYTSYGGSILSAEWLLAPYSLTGSPEQGDPNLRPHVVSNSWNYFARRDTTFLGAINAWRAAGIIPFFSAGNSGPQQLTSPADNCGVLAIGATTSQDGIAHFSGRGPGFFPACPNKPDLSAPGVEVRSSVPGGDYQMLDGTSMASPHAAGCAALLLSLSPGLSYTETASLMQTSARDLGTPGYDVNFGAGRLDCYAAAARLTFLNLTPRQAEVCRGDILPVTVRVVQPEQPQPVTLSALQPPAGLALSFAANPITPTVGALVTTTLSISVSNAASGLQPVVIAGVSASRTHTSTLALTVYAGPPQPVELLAPADGQVNTGRRPWLHWAGDQASSYFVEVSTSPDFSSLAYSRTVSGTSHQVLALLDFEQTYFWRVTPHNPCGSGAPSPSGSFLAETAVLRVNPAANGLNNGAAWPDAFTSLTAALAAAGPGSEIWLAAGRYQPGPDAGDSFVLADGMQIYGGFSGSETTRQQRNPNPHSNQTILDGAQVNRHVVEGYYLGEQTTLDGLTITGGNANLAARTGDSPGGGIYLVHSSPSLRNLWVVKNYALGPGGGASVHNGSPVFENVVFEENIASYGGGLNCFCQAAQLLNVSFLRNQSSGYGGGLRADGHITLINGVFAGNAGYGAGGAFIADGVLANIVFVGNQAITDGGGLVCIGNGPQLSQVTFAYNRARRGMGLYYNGYSYMPPMKLANAIFWPNNANQVFAEGSGKLYIESSLLPAGCPAGVICSGNLPASNPRFVRTPVTGADGVWGTADDDYGDLRLRPGSPALDAGNNERVAADWLDLDGDDDRAEPLPFDLDGAARFADVSAPDTGVGQPPLVDFGAYEADSTATTTPTPTATPIATSSPTPTLTPTSTHTSTPASSPTSTPTLTPPPPPSRQVVFLPLLAKP